MHHCIFSCLVCLNYDNLSHHTLSQGDEQTIKENKELRQRVGVENIYLSFGQKFHQF